jgi:hypothetical protein
VFAGGGGKAISMTEKYAPRLTDKVMEWTMTRMQQSDEPPRPLEENGLDKASGNLEERGGGITYVSESSLYTKASLHPVLTTALLLGAGLAFAAFWRPTQEANGRN